MRLAALVPVLLAAGPVLAQQVPEQSKMDLWCGLAFGIVATDAPVDVSDGQETIIRQLAEGGERLVGQAKAAYLENGHSDASFATEFEAMSAEVARQLAAMDNSVAYSFEECSALLGL